MEIFDMHNNRHNFIMPPKSIVMSELSDIGVGNDLYYSRNLFAKSIFRGRIKCALNLVNPLNKTVLDVGCGAGFMAYNLSANGAETVACDLRTKLKKVIWFSTIFLLIRKLNSVTLIYSICLLKGILLI